MSRGRFYIRSESEEWDFIRSLSAPAPFDAAVISDRYLPDYPAGHPRYGQPRDLIAHAFDAIGVPWSVDSKKLEPWDGIVPVPETARAARPRPLPQLGG